MKKNLILSFFKSVIIATLALTLFCVSTAGFAGAPESVSNLHSIKTNKDLKKYMYHFGTLVAGLEISRIKEKTPDWESIEVTLKEMNDVLINLQKADTDNIYKSYTDTLTTRLAEIQALNRNKNPKIYKSFDRLTQSCFQCHAIHRPVDFLQNKNGKLMGSKE